MIPESFTIFAYPVVSKTGFYFSEQSRERCRLIQEYGENMQWPEMNQYLVFPPHFNEKKHKWSSRILSKAIAYLLK